ncbi:GMC oxidoreductase [Paenibacillus sp. Soil522]|uniref:GMC oxidoreductase n=1 Tax=Paenibacillus sp. Soil522 TaxID=1736388 RepID=UPI0006FBF482|nr:GMC family oxidoreductase [Paenibacillus sp. Soil522]KRE47354.1 hypothetical protein ASG81_08580 [Paenibacillus sp. Soil522]
METCPYEFKPNDDEWIPTTPLVQMEQTEYDVLVAGTGAGGGAAIWRLCEKLAGTKMKIGVVEAGGLVLPTHGANLPLAGNYLSNPRVTLPIGQNMPDYPNATQVLALGGRTLFWGFVSPRLHPSEFLTWPLTYQELMPYYNIAEKVMNVSGDFLEDSTAQDVLLNRLWENGFPNVSYTPLAVYTKSSKYGKIFSTPFFSSINFFAYALNRRPFDLAIHASAVEVLHKNSRVSGLRVMTPDLRSHTIRAKNVILATSALENPRILLNSRIPGAAIGRFLVDQTFVQGLGTISMKQFTEIPGTVGILNPSSAEQPFQIQFFRAPWFGYQQFQNVSYPESLDLHLQGFGKMHSRYDNRVYLDPTKKDRYGVPLAQVQFSYHPDDYMNMERMVVTMKRMLSAMGVALKKQPGQPEFCLLKPGSSIHDAGTCRIGNNPYTSTANRYGQVHNVTGLYVAGNSVLPSMGGTNPTLTTVALAIRTADYVAHSIHQN